MAQHAIVARMLEVEQGGFEPVTPLSRLVLELVLARASSGDIVAEVAIGPYWAAIRRGPAALEPGTLRVAELYKDHFHLLCAQS
jgi:hypothetical protein